VAESLGSLVLAGCSGVSTVIITVGGGECLFFLNACRINAFPSQMPLELIRTIDYARLTYLLAPLVREIAAESGAGCY